MFTYTAEQLKSWKEKYGEGHIFELVVEDKMAILHKPSRQDISFASAGSSQGKDSLKFVEIVLKQCWIDGDMEIQENDDYFFGAVPVLEELTSSKKAEIKKL